ncbi:hypothetical protein [Sphingomonas sp. BK345]|uniref:hypothetical protein n=1 Tax=Sphingomonas sp. BK345 TaxID=2586980 RepID=UPI0016070FAA|nr:hypothetical protein [Sphingomonas sp. BK345]MBB3475583.1 hypothetical protein [Sphingomonas sp. BK345]
MSMFGPPQMSSTAFREQAARCRRLAAEVGNERDAANLLTIARENDQRAFYAGLIEHRAAKDLG